MPLPRSFVRPVLHGAASLLPLALAACSPRAALERLALGDDVARTRAIAYGPDARQRLDVYEPRDGTGAAPVIVFLYGGRWQSGDRRDYLLVADEMAERGWVVVVPDYRLYPAVRFPGWVEDAAAAVAWAHANAAAHGGDPSRLIVVGHSAGGHTAALLALDPRWLRAVDVPPGAVRGAAILAGPVDTVWTDPDVQALMGPRDGWPATYPATHVGRDAPPMLLLHGEADDTVDPANSRDLARRLRASGACARASTYAGIGHVRLVVALAVPGITTAPVLDDLAAFVRDPRGTCAGGDGADDAR